MKIFFKITPLIIVVITILIYKWTLFYKFDPVYFKDYYEHSQWNIALSPRIMGDEGLYQYSGYRLAKGDSPYNISPEVPPLGKYLYGISILISNNPYLPLIPLYMLTTLVFYRLTGFYLENKKSRLIATTLLLISPLYFSQISQTMLELPQLFFLLTHAFFIFKLIDNKRLKAFTYSLLAGLSLGAFYATKIGFLVPVIMLADIFILLKFKKLIYLIPIVIISGLLYLSTYLNYFLEGHSISEWVIGQKYIVKFYLNSQVHPIFGMVFLSLILGVFKGWWGSGWEMIKEWNIILAFGTIILLSKLKKPLFRMLNPYYQYLSILTAGFIFLYIFITFWPRYLTLVLPFLIILTVKFIEDKKSIYFKLLTIIVILQSLIFVSFQPKEDLKSISSLWEKGLYQDLYDYQISNISRQDFYISNLTFDKQVEVKDKKIKFEVPYVFPWQTKAIAKFTVEYKTKVGELTRAIPVEILKLNNKWKIFNWGNLFFGYNFGDLIIITPTSYSEGTLKTKEGLILSKDGESEFISVVPNLIQGEEIFKDLGKLTGQDNLYLRARTYVLYPGDWKVPIGFAVPGYDKKLLDKISKNPSVIIEKRQTRIYNPQLIENNYYKRILETEFRYPEIKARPGGKIDIIKSSEKINILLSESKNGQNTISNQSASEIIPEFINQPEQLKSQFMISGWHE